jgi:microcompartment protein CcmL/EutN
MSTPAAPRGRTAHVAVAARPVALAALETATVSSGVRVADAVVKTAPVELLWSEPVSPGKYVVVFGGGVGEVLAAYTRGREVAGQALLDDLNLPQCHPDVLAAFEGLAGGTAGEALGVFEADSIPATLLGADRAAKTAPVKLRRIRLAHGLGGRGYVVMDGLVSDVNASIAAARSAVGARLVDAVVIPRIAEPVRDRIY